MGFFNFAMLLWGIAFAGAPADELRQSLSKTDQFAHHAQMNGIEFRAYPEFWKRWRLVTSRYRTDSEEMRLTYANDIAWEALLKGRTDFPDGAVFGKVGYLTEEDPKFASSRVPGDTKRFQLMVRDKERFKATQGWGYALFNGSGETFAGEPKLAARACAACHAVVAERGYVFSRSMGEPAAVKINGLLERFKHSGDSRVQFDEIKTEKAPEELKKFFPAGVAAISVLRGPMAENPISGTLDEIRPELVQEASKRGRPAALIAVNGSAFSAVWADNSTACPAGQRRFGGLISYPVPKTSAERLLKLASFCH